MRLFLTTSCQRYSLQSLLIVKDFDELNIVTQPVKNRITLLEQRIDRRFVSRAELALVHAIVARHNGAIAVDDSPTLTGARFTMHLPLAD